MYVEAKLNSNVANGLLTIHLNLYFYSYHKYEPRYWFCYIAFIISLGAGSTSPSGHWFGGQHSWQSTWWLIKHFGRIISTTNSYSKSSRGGGILCASVLWWRSDCQGQWSGHTSISRLVISKLIQKFSLNHSYELSIS